MNKTPMLVAAGSLVVVAVMGFRVIQLEERLTRSSATGRVGTAAGNEVAGVDAGRASRSGGGADSGGEAGPRSARPGHGSPLQPERPGKVEDRDMEIARLQAEITRLRNRLPQEELDAVLRGEAVVDTPHLHTEILSLRLASGALVEVEDNRPAQIEHWTEGVGPKRSWGHEQATGAPDTDRAGDIPTAWASKSADSGVQWLKLDYDQPVDLEKINVMESHNPGAISKVAAVMPDGSERVVWEGTLERSTSDEVVATEFPVDAATQIQAQSVKVYVDTDRVPGWNEIDAVEVVGRNGTRQWASGSSSSSSYADR